MRTLIAKLSGGLAATLMLTTLPSIAPAFSAADPPDPSTTLGPSVASVSVKVRDLGANSSPDATPGTISPRVNPLPQRRGDAGPSTEDPSRRTPKPSSVAKGLSPAPDLVFDGTGNPAACAGCTPPDPTGDVGPNHYIQMVNATKVAIFNKSGVLQTPAFNLSALFTSGACSTGDRGDPQVVYDPLADRWVLSQFQDAPNTLCFAVSTTPDPLGAYYLYSFTTPEFPDYFKLGVWPSGYYVGTNESTYAAYAFDRSKMLLGLPATSIRFGGETNFLMPADVDGTLTPSAVGGLFYTFKDNVFHGGTDPDRLEVFALTPDFATPGSSTFAKITTIPIEPFQYTVCGFFILNCVPQRDTGQKVDPVSEWPMQRFAYRRLADRQALVGNFTVGGGSGSAGAAIRWFELADTGSGWSLKQEGTHDPGDGLDRWMGSIAMDANGSIALGYSASSPTEFPSLRYATRTQSDPPGTLQAERVMRAGGGSQTGSNRWGDYSAMSVDPSNERAFWYTGEYYATTSFTTWSTSIGTFTVPLPQAITFPQPADVSLDAGTVTLTATGGPSGNPVQFASTTPAVCTTSGPNGATVTLVAAGTCAITADQAGNANYEPAPQIQRSFQVTQGTQAITFPQPPDVRLDAGPVTLTATGGPSGNPVQFASTTPAVCTTGGPNGATLTLVATGTCAITADQAGNANYAAAAAVQRSFAVTTVVPIRQRPLDKCVVVPKRIPPRGKTKVLKKRCLTNAGQRVRVSVKGSLTRSKGSPVRAYYRVIRKANGAVFVQTRGYPLRLRIRWSAPAKGDYLAYKRLAKYRTRGKR